ncbi:hypothetical protein [Streptomyces sp. NPDC002676]
MSPDAQQRRAAWESGLTAQARAIRAWTTTRTVNNVPQRVQWHEYDYTTVDGRAVRFKESGGPRHRAEGDRPHARVGDAPAVLSFA